MPASASETIFARGRARSWRGLYPGGARGTRTAAKGRGAGHGAYGRLLLEGAGGQVRAWMHPGSLNAAPVAPADGFYVFLEKVESSRLFVRESTSVSPLALLVLGAQPHDISVERVRQTGRAELGAGISVRISPDQALCLKLLRRALDDLLCHHLMAAPQAAVAPAAGAAGAAAGGSELREALRHLLSKGH